MENNIISIEIQIPFGKSVDIDVPLNATKNDIIEALIENQIIFGNPKEYSLFLLGKQEIKPNVTLSEAGVKEKDYLSMSIGNLYNLREIKNQKKRKLAIEHQNLIEYSKIDNSISFEFLDLFESLENKAYINQSLLKNNPPTKYLVRINQIGIVGINNDRSPIYGENHSLEIKFGSDYPLNPPILTMLTDIWHPNIRCLSNLYKGRVCVNSDVVNNLNSLDQVVISIKDMISYRYYQAENKSPHPEDPEVAKWVREYAEPKGIIIKGEGINIKLARLNN